MTYIPKNSKTKKALIGIALLNAIDAGIRMLEYWPREIRIDLWQCPYCHEEGKTADDIQHIQFDPDDPMADPECPVVAQEKSVAEMQAILEWYK